MENTDRLRYFEAMDTTLSLSVCTRCKQQKSKAEFRQDSRYKSGVNSWCKRCLLDYKAEQRRLRPKVGHLRPCVDGQYLCRSCGERKPKELYYKSSYLKCGVSSYCKDCERHKKIAFRLEDPERYKQIKQRSAEKRKLYRKAAFLGKLYGITLEQYNVLLEVQNGKCAICGSTKEENDKKRDLCVDHNHATKRVRGLLCGNCNRGVGYFKEDIDRLKSAIAYLEKHRE